MTITKLVNLTPHNINVKGNIISTSGTIARVKVIQEEVPAIIVEGNLLPIFECKYGEVENLPEPQEGVMYIVSAMVRSACLGRTDILSPCNFLRDKEGKIIGCGGLEINKSTFLP